MTAQDYAAECSALVNHLKTARHHPKCLSQPGNMTPEGCVYCNCGLGEYLLDRIKGIVDNDHIVAQDHTTGDQRLILSETKTASK